MLRLSLCLKPILLTQIDLFFLIPESPQINGESGSALWGWLGGPGAPVFQLLQLRVHATSNGTNIHMGQLLELQI